MNREETPRKYRGLWDKGIKGNSRAAAIRLYCLECVSYVQKEVHLCASKTCPLYKYRMYDA